MYLILGSTRRTLRYRNIRWRSCAKTLALTHTACERGAARIDGFPTVDTLCGGESGGG